MAASIIQYDATKQPVQAAVRAMQKIREGLAELGNARAVMLQFRDGDGTSAAHYDLLATACAYAAGDYVDANTAAKASFDEIDSLYAKLSGDGTVSAVNAAILQAPAKHGV